MLHAECVGTFMICLHRKFHMPNSNGSSVITKPKAKYEFHIIIKLIYILRTVKGKW